MEIVLDIIKSIQLLKCGDLIEIVLDIIESIQSGGHSLRLYVNKPKLIYVFWACLGYVKNFIESTLIYSLRNYFVRKCKLYCKNG